MIIKNPRDSPLQHFSSRKDVDIMQIPHKNGSSLPPSSPPPPSLPPSLCILLRLALRQRRPRKNMVSETKGNTRSLTFTRLNHSHRLTQSERVPLIITLFQLALFGVEFGVYRDYGCRQTNIGALVDSSFLFCKTHTAPTRKQTHTHKH